MGCMPAWPRCMTMRNWVGLGGRAAHPEPWKATGPRATRACRATTSPSIEPSGQMGIHGSTGRPAHSEGGAVPLPPSRAKASRRPAPGIGCHRGRCCHHLMRPSRQDFQLRWDAPMAHCLAASAPSAPPVAVACPQAAACIVEATHPRRRARTLYEPWRCSRLVSYRYCSC